MEKGIYNLFIRNSNLWIMWHTPTSAIITIRMIRSVLYDYYTEKFIDGWDDEIILKCLKTKIKILYYKRVEDSKE